ncbi:Scramblase-domain-containing protein [Lentinus tigrinus ALCF2SS1-7]|uniref:Scramblase-domain-containing protein n=1 Tax=Lentinus tigrinus ALCF2SS1-7 TaxID=1328758 RepID=UPI001165E061|nr:Scramblase-domain-containing protein [Lentinus tigrinus ALCF2SS1-7]
MLGIRTTSRYASLVARSSHASRPPHLPALGSVLTTRTYAFSRFEKSRPGVGRERPRSSQFTYEERPSAEESPLWEQSVRPPASNPEDGLRRLLMQHDSLVVTRQIEMLNIFIGLEQTNRYAITNEAGETLGYIAEEPRGFLAAFSRQIFRTHRPFRAIVMDTEGSPILWLRRPFAFINSRMYVQRLKDFSEYTPEGNPVLDTFAEVQQRWHLWRRRYDLFLRETPHRILSTVDEPQPEPEPEMFRQFARIDNGFLAWHFTLRDATGQAIANVNRAFRGFGRELFTDTGQYFINFDGKEPHETDELAQRPRLIRKLSLEERALILATAVNIDFDYFSRHSEGGGGGLFFLSTVE